MRIPIKRRDGSPYEVTPRIIGAVVIGVLALIFIFQNTGRSRVHLLFWNSNRALWLWLLIVFAAGFVVGSIFPWFRRRVRRSSDETPSS
jgi:uncharacterized integral membrane protein